MSQLDVRELLPGRRLSLLDMQISDLLGRRRQSDSEQEYFPWKVPYGLHVGDEVTVRVPEGYSQAGRQLDFVIPHGSKARDILEIPIPHLEGLVDDDDDDDDDGPKDGQAGVGIVFAPGPDSGLYVKTIVVDGPTWITNEEAVGMGNGVDGSVRVGDCLLDVQEAPPGQKKGLKKDVFAKPVAAVVPLLLGAEGSTVELSFRRVTNRGDAILITVPIVRGKKATPSDVEAGRSTRYDAERYAKFKELDEDGSGQLSLNEVFQYLLKNPIPGSKSFTQNVWEATVLLFTRADRDGSGTIDMDEFEGGFNELVDHYRRQGEMEAREDSLEHRFQTTLQSVENDLIATIGEFSKKDFMRLMNWVKDPEDTMLLYSMYSLEDWNFETARAVLQLNLLHKDPEKFWIFFGRAQIVLKQARLVVVHAETSEDRQQVDREMTETRDGLKTLNQIPEMLTEEVLVKELAALPMIRNLTGRQPGRGFPTRQWVKFDTSSFASRQKKYEMPSPFWGRIDSVFACIDSLKKQRLTTMVSGMGTGKSTVALAVLATLQKRAKEDGGVYMYKDGVFMVDCVPITSYERLYFSIGQVMGLIVRSMKEFGHYIRSCQMLIVLDGVHEIVKLGLDNMQKLIYDLLEEVPGLSLLITSRSALAVPYESIFKMPPADDSTLSKIIRHFATVPVHSGDMIMNWLYGNPLVARCASALLTVVKPKELCEIMELRHQKDLRTLNLGHGDPDPWVDSRCVWRTPDGKAYGDALCVRAWVGIVLSHLQMKHTRCYDFVRLLHMVPSGLFHLEVDAILFQSDIILKLALDTYGLVYAIDKKGQRFKNFYEASKHPGGASYLLEDFAAHEIDASGVPMPSVSKVMLKLYLPVIDDQIDDINHLMTKGATNKALKRLKRRENTLWACSRYETLMRDDMFWNEIDALEAAGKLALFGSMLMLSLQRLPEALLSAVNAARLFSRVFDLELEPETVKERKQNPVLKVRGPMALGQALRVTGEIKLQMGAVESARKDLADSFKLQKRIKEPMLSFYFTGSRLGQADVLWSLAEAALTCGNFEVAKNLANSCLVIYEDLSSSIGLGMARMLLACCASTEGDIVFAMRCVNEAVSIFREYEQPGRLAEALIIRAEISAGASNLARSRVDLDEVMLIAGRAHDLITMGQAKKLQGEACLMLGDGHGAMERLEEAKEFGLKCGSYYLIGEAERLMGEAKTTTINLGETEPRYAEARALLRASIESLKKINYQLGIANALRAMGNLHIKSGHHKHARASLLESLEIFQKLDHSLGIAVVKAAIGKLQIRKGKTQDVGRMLLMQTVDDLKHVEQKQLEAERKGMLEVEGVDLQADKAFVEQNRIEDDPFWREQLPNIDYVKARAENPGDVVRAVFGTVWQAGQDPERIEVTVGKTGVRHLDLAQVWTPKDGWQFSDEADHRAYDEIHWKSIDKGGHKAQAAMLAASHRRYEALLLFIGIRQGDSDERIGQMAERAFEYFDDDNSGELNTEELDDAFNKMGINLSDTELKELVDEVDVDGNGLIDKDEFTNMVLVTIRRMKEDDSHLARPAALDIFEQENQYRKKLLQQQARLLQKAPTSPASPVMGNPLPLAGGAPSILISRISSAASHVSSNAMGLTSRPPATEAELAAIRHKLQYKPGAFASLGVSNGIPHAPGSAGASQAAQERPLSAQGSGLELEDLIRERERRMREREGGRVPRVQADDSPPVAKGFSGGRDYYTLEETMAFVDEHQEKATQRSRAIHAGQVERSELPEVEM